jgi:hypothetical protein
VNGRDGVEALEVRVLAHKDFILSEAKDLARKRFDLGGEGPSVAALPQDEDVSSELSEPH